MKINDILVKIVEIEKDMTREKGEFIFFALILRVDIFEKESIEKWDVAVCASWITPDLILEINKDIYSRLLAKFTGEEIASFLGTISIVNPRDEFPKIFTSKLCKLDYSDSPMGSLRENTEIKEGTAIRKAYVLISNPQLVDEKEISPSPSPSPSPAPEDTN